MSGDVLDLRPRLNPEGQPRKGDIRTLAIAAEEWDGAEWVPLSTADDTERTLAWSRIAAESVRAANHAAYHAPTGDTGNVYDRCGSMHELLLCAEQLVRVLGDHASALAAAPGLFSDDDKHDAEQPRGPMHAMTAYALLTSAAGHVESARRVVNAAWSALSHLGVRHP